MKQSSYIKCALLLIGIALLVSLLSSSDIIGMWTTVTFLVVGGLILLFSIITQIKDTIKPNRHIYFKDFSLKFIAKLMGLFLIIGTLSYLYVFYTIAHDAKLTNELTHAVQFSNAEYLLRSLICSLDLFMLDVDSNVLDRLDTHPALKGWLAVEAILSFACTVAMLVQLVYSRLKSFYRLNYNTKIDNNHNHLYLFFGSNTPSELLIKDIKSKDPKAIAIIIDEANVEEENNNEWEGIVSLITHKHKVFKTAEKIGAHVAIASQKLDDIDEDIANREDFDAFGYLGLSRIKKFIAALYHTSDPKLHIFFMGDDEELNIRNIITLAKDTTIISLAKDKESLYHRIYCHARYNGPNRVIQDVALKKHLDIKIVDSSHIAVELLKSEKKYHPVNVVKVSDKCPTTVTNPLKTLIIGFGEVGRDAFRFLYEFGTFADSNDPNIRSPFECVIVDSRLDNIKGSLMASMPGIFSEKPENVKIDFHETDYNSRLFNMDILNDTFLKEVNYIVISIGDTDEAIALAARIFNRARKLRKDISDLRILVRCTDDNKYEGVKKIADHYNYGYGKGLSNTEVINVFGQPKMTYTFDLVVSDKLIEEGKLFHEKYRVISGEGATWDERHKKPTETDPPNIEKLRKLRRQESQDQANALHAATKIILLEKAMKILSDKNDSALDWYSFYLNYFNPDGTANVSGSQKDIYYSGLSMQENQIILHLAMLEHLRWNAAHELMGYVFNSISNGCDERTMEHNCLCGWSKLDSQSDRTNLENRQKGENWTCDYKKYDFCVIDTSIALYQDTLLPPKR